jgi:hypothetical protein
MTPQNLVSIRNPSDLESLARACIVASDCGGETDVQYSCQATQLPLATSPLQWWQPQQYVKDLVSRNVRVRDFVRYWSIATFNAAMRSYGRLVDRFFSYSFARKLIPVAQAASAVRVDGSQKASAPRSGLTLAANRIALPRGAARKIYNMGKQLNSHLHRYPYVYGLANGKTPAQTLDLQPGEWVQVRPLNEIRLTINGKRRNRGLKFDVEMVPYCGKTFRVLARVDRIINERTGRMMNLPNACVILENVTCSGCFSQDRLFCPRSIYPYWHEIWLRRSEQQEASAQQ